MANPEKSDFLESLNRFPQVSDPLSEFLDLEFMLFAQGQIPQQLVLLPMAGLAPLEATRKLRQRLLPLLPSFLLKLAELLKGKFLQKFRKIIKF